MSPKRKFVYAGLFAALLPALAIVAATATMSSQTVEVYPSVKVTRRTYDVPLNEQPFYGFAKKSEAMLAADRKFIDAVDHNTGREAGADEFQAIGWDAVKNGDYATAAKRFNQAWLLSPGRSATVHGLAVVAARRFGDLDFALELAADAANLRQPLAALPGDRGGLLLQANRPAQAIPLLEQATAALPDWVNPHINLALARYETGDVAEACRQLGVVDRILQEKPGARSPTIEDFRRSLGEKVHCASM